MTSPQTVVELIRNELKITWNDAHKLAKEALISLGLQYYSKQLVHQTQPQFNTKGGGAAVDKYSVVGEAVCIYDKNPTKYIEDETIATKKIPGVANLIECEFNIGWVEAYNLSGEAQVKLGLLQNFHPILNFDTYVRSGYTNPTTIPQPNKADRYKIVSEVAKRRKFDQRKRQVMALTPHQISQFSLEKQRKIQALRSQIGKVMALTPHQISQFPLEKQRKIQALRSQIGGVK